jgi:hypothetical protein
MMPTNPSQALGALATFPFIMYNKQVIGTTCPVTIPFFFLSILYMGKVRAYPSEALFMCFTLEEAPGLNYKQTFVV